MDAITGAARSSQETHAAAARWSEPRGAVCAAPPDRPADRGDRRRARVGETQAEIRTFPAQRAVQLRFGAAHVVLVAALDGGAEVICESGAAAIDPAVAVLLSRSEPVTVVWRAGSRELVLHLSRQRLQALASAVHGGGRRLSTASHRVLRLEAAGPLNLALTDLRTLLASDTAELGLRGRTLEGRALEEWLHRALQAALVEGAAVDEVFPLARAVTDAMRRVENAPHRVWDAVSLAATTGVTVPVLRRGFRAHLGKSIGAFVLESRLGLARRSLASARDSRPMSQVAESVGFSTPGSFSRAYVRLFGQSPSETRARAVRASGEPTPGDGASG